MSLRVYLVSRPQINLDAILAFLADNSTSWSQTPETSDAEKIIECAGRVCYMSFGKKQSPRTNSEYIQRLIEMGHESVLEHANWGFLLTGISRGFTHQLVRHRVGFAFSQLSQQYHDESEADFVEPAIPSSEIRATWKRTVSVAKKAYRDILRSLLELENNSAYSELEKKEVRRAIYSAARSVLPNATETKIFVTANTRSLRYFFGLRGSIPGDLEMRRVAAEMLKHMKAEAPSLFFDFEIEKMRDGSPIIKKRPTFPIYNNQVR